MAFNLRQAIEQELGRELTEDELDENLIMVTAWPSEDDRVIDLIEEIIQQETHGKLTPQESGALNGHLTAVLEGMFILGRYTTVSPEDVEQRLGQFIEKEMREAKARGHRDERMIKVWPEIARRVYG